MDAIIYQPTKVASSKTHRNTIDIEIFDKGGDVRVFLSRELALDLIHKMLCALEQQKEEVTNEVK